MDQDALAELRRRADAADGFVALLTEQLRVSQDQARRQEAQNRQLTTLVKGMQKQLASALADLQKALAELAARKRKKGKADSDVAEPPPTPDPALPPPLPDPPPMPKPRTNPKRKPKRPAALPAHLPRNVIAIAVTSCGSCGEADLTRLTRVGEGEISERYDYVPAHIQVERIERATCRCLTCGGFTTAPLPPTAVPGGSMTAPLLAHIAYSKCCLHLPLDRIAEDLRCLGADFAEATMCDAMGHIAELVPPICDAILDDLFASGLVHLDGTGVKVLMPGEKGSYRGQFTVVSNGDATAYFFSESKDGTHLASFLRVGTPRAYKGYLVADAASNMNLLYADGTIVECGCWYHARAMFEEAQLGAPFESAEGIAWIGALFEVEHEADHAGDTAAQRKARRQLDSKAVLDELLDWMDKTQPRFDRAEEIWKAIQYCRNHWGPLTRFLTEGRIPLTNNQAERDLGPIGRGRKAWLFAGSDRGGHRLAAIYTVIGTCLRLDIDPRVYLTEVLPRLSTMPANRGRGQLAVLTPRGWKAARAAAAAADPVAVP